MSEIASAKINVVENRSEEEHFCRLRHVLTLLASSKRNKNERVPPRRWFGWRNGTDAPDDCWSGREWAFVSAISDNPIPWLWRPRWRRRSNSTWFSFQLVGTQSPIKCGCHYRWSFQHRLGWQRNRDRSRARVFDFFPLDPECHPTLSARIFLFIFVFLFILFFERKRLWMWYLSCCSSTGFNLSSWWMWSSILSAVLAINLRCILQPTDQSSKSIATRSLRYRLSIATLSKPRIFKRHRASPLSRAIHCLSEPCDERFDLPFRGRPMCSMPILIQGQQSYLQSIDLLLRFRLVEDPCGEMSIVWSQLLSLLPDLSRPLQ